MKKILAAILIIATLIPMAVTVPVSAAYYSTPFSDVSPTAWYARGIQYCNNKGYISGMGYGKYWPDYAMTREQFVMILSKVAGADLSGYTGNTGFSDVPSGQWYSSAVKWAVQKGYCSGMGGGKFGRGQYVTREQLAMFLYNYASKNGRNMYGSANLKIYSDNAQISNWAKTSFAWAVYEGLITSMYTNAYVAAPRSYATRAQAAAIFMRFDTTLAGGKTYYDAMSYVKTNLKLFDFDAFRRKGEDSKATGVFSLIGRDFDSDGRTEFITFTATYNESAQLHFVMDLYEMNGSRIKYCDRSQYVHVSGVGNFNALTCGMISGNNIMIYGTNLNFGGSSHIGQFMKYAISNNKFVLKNNFMSSEIYRYDSYEYTDKATGRMYSESGYNNAVKAAGFDIGHFATHPYVDVNNYKTLSSLKGSHIFTIENDRNFNYSGTRGFVHDNTGVM